MRPRAENVILALLVLVVASRRAGAQTAPLIPPAPPPPALAVQAPPEPAKESAPAAKLAGYVEASYAYNFNRPSNGITNFRGFDNRHDTFTLGNVVLDGSFDHKSLVGRLALQVGQTPNTYYLSEPKFAG